MKKIAVLTFPKSYNYGAFLQCWTLAMRIKQDFNDADVEIIDYDTKSISKKYATDIFGYAFKDLFSDGKIKTRLMRTFKNLYIIMFKYENISEIKKRNNCFKNNWKHLPLSSYSLVSDDYNKFFEIIKKQNYDAIVVGSDAVWNWVIRGFPNAYFLNADLGAAKLSYAASCYGQEYWNINSKQKEYIDGALGDFFYIGVREKSGEDFVRSINPCLTVHHNCDPTVLLDVNIFSEKKRNVANLLRAKGINFDKPIIGLMGGEWLGKLARDIVGNEYQLVAVYEPNKYADFFLPELSPFEWACIFSFFAVTFTHFFHGTLLSLRNLTPVFAVEVGTSAYAQRVDTKIRDLLKRLDLTDFYYLKAELESKGIESAGEKIIEYVNSPPKERIRLSLEKEAQYYNSFKEALKKVLGEE